VSQPVSQSITRRSASNLALAFIVLPKPKREAMAALYAFCREVDDEADEASVPVEERRRRLTAWRDDIRRACAGQETVFQVNRELTPIIQRYRLPVEYFEELLQGVETDLSVMRYETFAQLEEYAYRVASVVGLLSIEIFGYQNPRCREYAIHLGKALQFTNILRDVGNDATRGRIYIPAEALREFAVTEESILSKEYSDRFRRLIAGIAERTRGFYCRARQSLPSEDRRAMIAAELMGSVYWRLLRKLESQQFRVLEPRPARLSKLVKLGLILRTWLRLSMGISVPNYGPA
jgi:phytoene synthase